MYSDFYMNQALIMAEIAFEADEVPVGAIVVKDGIVIGTGFNKVMTNTSVSSHAEILAINNASKALKNYRLNNCELYVTLEPCHMCAKALVDSRIDNLYFGANFSELVVPNKIILGIFAKAIICIIPLSIVIAKSNLFPRQTTKAGDDRFDSCSGKRE